jgi:hypothetical protein
MNISTKLERLRRGSSGWFYVAIGIIVWDLCAEEDEQLTRAFRRGFKTRKTIVSLSWAYITAHLFGVIPDQYDIIHISGTTYRRRLHGYQDSSRAART